MIVLYSLSNILYILKLKKLRKIRLKIKAVLFIYTGNFQVHNFLHKLFASDLLMFPIIQR